MLCEHCGKQPATTTYGGFTGVEPWQVCEPCKKEMTLDDEACEDFEQEQNEEE